ncbi:hypothetical protein HYS94_00975 [Candidatus Daviesbacteria bacterium]|nr:hypothetical protein [Candidatus Daviesbacteria bacterium]
MSKLGFRLQVLGYSILFYLFTVTCPLSTVSAIVDPLTVPNNKFGIHIIQATPDESSPAAQLVNTNGDWGYITFLIESKDRNQGKWQEFFNDLRKRHLIPIVRLATKPLNEHWERPYEGEEQAWADFLDNLNWPTKNRYVIIYNEPNHGKEWNNVTDPISYAQVLNKTIDALKKKSEDFFVLNAGLDASAPHQPPNYFDERLFLQEMEKAVPGIFNKLDGWVSHSYPNPEFRGSPTAVGRGTVKTYIWELQVLRSLGLSKDLPVFITETGWKHAEGVSFDPSLPSADTVATHYKNAFEGAWNSQNIVAITPFLLSYQEPLFAHFSFKKVESSEFYPQFQTILDMPKIAGKPRQENRAQLEKGEIFSTMVAGEEYNISLKFKNNGQSIWNDGDLVKLKFIQGADQSGIAEIPIPKDIKVEPGKEYTFNFSVKAPIKGPFKSVLNLFSNIRQFDSPPLEFNTQIKSPVILKLKSSLKWKESAEGEYLLRIEGPAGESLQAVNLDDDGLSKEMEARYLLPDYAFDFTLERKSYHPVTIRQKVLSGLNTLDFGELQPAILANLLNPKELWQLLPFSD